MSHEQLNDVVLHINYRLEKSNIYMCIMRRSFRELSGAFDIAVEKKKKIKIIKH